VREAEKSKERIESEMSSSLEEVSKLAREVETLSDKSGSFAKMSLKAIELVFPTTYSLSS
jgi:hypothetical protein